MTNCTPERTWSQSLEWETATARAAIYDLCVHALAWPSTERLARLDELAVLLHEIVPEDPVIARDVAAVLDAIEEGPDIGELRRAHGLLFTQVDSQDCPPHETAFNAHDVFRQTEVMADIAGFYLAHGLKVGGAERERPDHIETELEFMAFMGRKEAWALDFLGEDEVAECRHTQDTFLRDHLGCWGPAFGRRAAVLGAHPLHTRTGTLVHDWILADMAGIGIEPTCRYDEPLPMPEPDDGECGPPCAGEAVPVPVELRPNGGRR